MSTSTSRFEGSAPSVAHAIRRADQSKRAVRQRGGHTEEEPDVAVWVGSDGDDVDGRLSGRRNEGVLVDPERKELDVRRLAVPRHPVAELRSLVLAVRDDRRRGGERSGVHASHALRAKTRKPLGKPDGGVHERWSNSSRPVEEHERNPDRVHSGENDARAVRAAQRREHRLEVAAVASRALQSRLHRRTGRARPGGRRPRALEIVVRDPPTFGELVQAEEEVAIGRSDGGGERSPPLRRVAKSMEHGARDHGR